MPGRTLGRYELLMPVARGGMGQLWAAQLHGTRGFQKVVAIKTLLPEALDDTHSEQMFLEEARIAAQIHHPNVVQTLDLGEEEGTLYLVMEWVHGEPLSRLCQQAAPKGGVPIPVIVNIVGQACRGLHSAHELCDEAGALLGLVHRDVTPHNLLVTYEGTAKLADFGIAKVTAQGSSLTRAGEVKGKVGYLAPEQLCGQTLDRRADIFSLGVVLYLLTTGEHPFKGDNPGETVRKLCTPYAPRPPSELVAHYPPALEQVVLRALEKAPEARWRTAQDLLAALAAALPEAFQDRFETRVAACMNEVFGIRGAERLAALRQSQQLAEQGRPPLRSGFAFKPVHGEGQDTGSVGGTARSGSMAKESPHSERHASTPEAFDAAERADAGLELQPVRSRASGSAALVMTVILGVCSLLLGLLLGYHPDQVAAPPEQPSHASPRPAVPPARPAASVEPRAIEPVPPISAQEPVQLDARRPAPEPAPRLEERPAARRDAELPAKPPSRAARRPAHARAVEQAPPASAAAPAAAPSTLERAHTQKSEWKGNAWNADAFGGRN